MYTRNFTLLVLSLLSFISLSLCQQYSAIAVIQGWGSNAGITGNVIFGTNGEGQGIFGTVSICGVSPSTSYYFRIYTYGDLTSASFGGVYNPLNADPTCNTGRPSGDLGGLTSNSTGCITGTLNQDTASIFSNDTTSIIGRTVILQGQGSCGQNISSPIIGLGVVGYQNGSSYVVGTSSVTVNSAVAIFTPTSSTYSTVLGSALLVASGTGVQVTIYVKGVTPYSTHGIHIHNYGDITNSATAGEHFNPFNTSHGCPGVSDYSVHAGDMGNWVADANGFIFASVFVANSTLTPGAVNSVLGRAIVIHLNVDTCPTQPTGNSGPRASQGVIGIADSTIVLPSAIAVFQDLSTLSIIGTAVFNTLFDGSSWGVNVQIVLSGLLPNDTKGFQINQYGDLTSVNSLGSSFSPTVSGSCVYVNKGIIIADQNGNATINIFTTGISLNPNSATFIIGRSAVIWENPSTCGSGSILAAGVIGYQLNSPVIATNGSQQTTTPTQAICIFQGLSGYNISGSVTFTLNSTAGVNVNFVVSGLVSNITRSFHIHNYGDISYSTGDGLGEHFNPFNQSHSCPYNPNRHAGDMGYFTPTLSGTLSAFEVNNIASLNPTNPAFIIGRGVIIHGGQDDCVTQPTGNSGPRIAQCAIGYSAVSSPTNSPTNSPTKTPTSKPASASSFAPIALIAILLASFSLFA